MAEVSTSSSFEFIGNESNATLWEGGVWALSFYRMSTIRLLVCYNQYCVVQPAGVPRDGSPSLMPLSIPILSVYYILATVGLVYSAVCFIFNTVFRKRT